MKGDDIGGGSYVRTPRPIPTESDIPMHGWRPYSDFHRERIRAHAKHDNLPMHRSQERLPWIHDSWLRVLVEEVGECSRVLNDWELGELPADQVPAALRSELVQVGAMAAAWIDAIDDVYYIRHTHGDHPAYDGADGRDAHAS